MSSISKILDLLSEAYPKSRTSLNYKNPFQLLVATMLSAQSTDKAVNKITPVLFKKYQTPESMANTRIEELIEQIRSIGLYNTKAKNLIAMAKEITDKYKGKVPRTIKDLTALPGVGRKTATAVLINAFGITDQGITVDTHMMRITRKLGWTTIEKNNALKIEQELMKIIPQDRWATVTHLIIDHGRTVCRAKKPLCDKCIIERYCPSSELKK